MSEDEVRAIVRDEIASLAGKAFRRTQDREYTRVGERNTMVDIANEQMAQFWGEVLAEYGGGWPTPPEAVEVPPEASSR